MSNPHQPHFASDFPLQPATTYAAIVGAVLVALRETRGITQAQVATHLGLAASTWSRVENGCSALNVDQLAQVATFLGVTPGMIFTRADAVSDAMKQRSVRVEPTRVSANDAVAMGMVIIGAAALTAVVVAALANNKAGA